MPINIYERESLKEITYLDSYWDLPNQIEELEDWLSKTDIPAGDYIADIGFDIRPNASSTYSLSRTITSTFLFKESE